MQSVDIETRFHNCLSATEHHYKEHLLDPACPLESHGPMTMEEARSFFIQYSIGTQPLYILLRADGYYAYY